MTVINQNHKTLPDFSSSLVEASNLEDSNVLNENGSEFFDILQNGEEEKSQKTTLEDQVKTNSSSKIEDVENKLTFLTKNSKNSKKLQNQNQKISFDHDIFHEKVGQEVDPIDNFVKIESLAQENFGREGEAEDKENLLDSTQKKWGLNVKPIQSYEHKIKTIDLEGLNEISEVKNRDPFAEETLFVPLYNDQDDSVAKKIDTPNIKPSQLSNRKNLELSRKNIALSYLSNSSQDSSQLIEKLKKNSLEKKPIKFKDFSVFENIENDKIFEFNSIGRTQDKKEFKGKEVSLKNSNDFLGSNAHLLNKMTSGNSSSFQNDLGKIQQTTSLIDMSHVDTDKIIEKITNYISINSLGRFDKLSLSVNHNELGRFQIQTSKNKSSNDLISLQITTENSDGLSFFNQNKVELIHHLNNSGIKLMDFHINSAKPGQFSNQENQKFDLDLKYSQDQNQSKDQNESQDQRGDLRRKAMWEYYKERMAS